MMLSQGLNGVQESYLSIMFSVKISAYFLAGNFADASNSSFLISRTLCFSKLPINFSNQFISLSLDSTSL